jgi:hypothetical protein
MGAMSLAKVGAGAAGAPWAEAVTGIATTAARSALPPNHESRFVMSDLSVMRCRLTRLAVGAPLPGILEDRQGTSIPL